MTTAVISDVHGNIEALDAVIASAERMGVTGYVFLGDLVAYGPRPVEVLRRIAGLPFVACVRGNTDRYVTTGDLRGMIPRIDPPASIDDALALAAMRESLAWTRGCLVATGGYRWLAELPIEQRVVLSDGTEVLAVHGSPGRDDGVGLRDDADEEALVELGFGSAGADLILSGHTHVRADRRVGRARCVNPGSVSLSHPWASPARWVALETTARGHELTFHESEYDLDSVADDLDAQAHPSAEWLRSRRAPSQRTRDAG